MGHSERDRLGVRLCWAVAIAAVVLGLWFRLSGLTSAPLWLDESYSAFAADHDLSFIWTVVPKYDVHPPLYYSMLHVWDALFGNSLLVRRLLGLLCGSATIGVAAACGTTWGRLIGDGRTGRALIATMATALAALQPMMILMTQQVRPYPVMIAVYAVGILAILKIASARRADIWRAWAAVAFSAEALMLWLHSLGPFYAASVSIALIVVLLPKKPKVAQWLVLLAGQALVGLLYLPAALILRDQAPSWIQSSWLTFRPDKLLDDLATIYLTPSLVILSAGVTLLAIGITVAVRRGAGSAAAALLVLGFLPTSLALLTSWTLAPVFLPRTLSPSTIPILILIAGSLGIAPRWRQIVAALGLILILPFTRVDFQTMGLPPTEDWRGAVAWLSAHMNPGDVIWAYPNDGALPLTYAMRDLHRAFAVRQIPTNVPAIGYPGVHPDGGRATIALSVRQIDALVRTEAPRVHSTIWLLGLSPNDLMKNALGRSRTPIAYFERDAIKIVGMARRDAPATPASNGRRPAAIPR